MSGVPGPDHVGVDLDGAASEAWLRCADVLFGRGAPPRAAELLSRYPGCLLVSLRDADGRCVTLARVGAGRVEARVCGDVHGGRDHAALADRLYRRLVAGTY